MTQKLTNKTYCLIMTNGIEIWITEEEASKIGKVLKEKPSGMLAIDGNLIQKRMITGLFSAELVEDFKCEKRGMWKCGYGNWHRKNDDCLCGRQH